MTTHEKETFLQTYQWASEWSQLPWAHDEPTLFLPEICKQRPPGKALDIGCGSGTDSVYLAMQGWDVTALDFVPKALEFTQQRAQAAGADVTPVEADITTWNVPHEFDLVLDHGLLHNMDPVRYDAYRERVMDALAPEGDFVLLHWHPLYPGQGNGKVGPNRTSREDIKAFFAPDFHERFFAREEFEDLPDMVGGGMTQAYYWFQRNLAELRPSELIEQVRSTLERHSVATDAEPEISDELWARIVGPGRLGLTHARPEPADAREVLSQWVVQHGADTADLPRLLAVFASDEFGALCGGAPKCGECNVTFCKRLRSR